ncbi:host specificity factor TipJ family phage tail protein [Luteimonas sp. S4-F44]|uniref:host specificity factor TipJ family phage tail protein n=1 Tax=Luteimonas sp. S4-F44 TaxID=2925842 RepID=UPI001F531682|nr:host specificity factor TipJ family phage tail protein [Luteimonas sp. S4-F44]UNK43458.1 host specificity factor TipJ family phage tail protein [Luteimonas sp. S4-F44]
MGLIECPPVCSRLITSPHPVTDDGQQNRVAQLLPGEKLGDFLRREVDNWTGDAWEVRINGVLVPVELMERVRPRDGTLIEVRSLVGKQALYIVALAVLTYFTFGGGATGGGILGNATGVGTFFGASGFVAAGLASATFVAGSMLINKVLGPKPAGSGQSQQNTVYNVGSSRNQARQYQPFALTFGRVKFAPDVLSAPYSWYEGDDQFVGLVLTPGVNVHRVEELYLGDALLSSFEGVETFYAGFPGMPEQKIPLYSNADTIQGGELNKDRTWVQRTTPARTVRIQINLEYVLGDQTSKGKPYTNIETVEVQYCPVGTGAWTPLVSRNFANSDYNPHRATLARDVPEGQYDVRVRIQGRAIDGGGSNGRSQWQWTTMTAVQTDTTDYAGIPRIGVRMKASGQLQNAPDEIRCVVVSRPVPVWTGAEWVTRETSNPGAHLLAYARGINDENGRRIAGIGLSEEMIDIAGLQAFMAHCEAESFSYNYVVKDARNHDEMVNSLALAGFSQVTWAQGRLSPVWAADEQPLSGVVGMGNIKRGQFQVDYTLANAADGIEFTYYDAEDWSTKTLRIPAPGATTMLNPAQVTGEGITSEAHAAMIARWHLAQSLFQYKSITYATNLEHLSYRRLSMLSLSHDLTQWGISGTVKAARIDNGVVTIELDEPVPPPEQGRAYLGLRIPGERNYRVFEVRPFVEKSSVLQLVDAWPSDAALPGDSEGNPAWDTLWCYDFKSTPGYRVRVVAMEPEADMKGARVSVVPEGPEFWEYVRTGRYIRPPNQSLLQTRPVASDLQVSERQVVQGDTVYTELVAQWEVSGPVGDTVVQMADANGQLQEVARTTTRSAAWRIPGAGTYQIAVRPFAPDGRPGIATGTIYSTIGADAPPVLIDLFDVEERSGGVRLYTWGWFDGTTRSADFAGVEIRVTAGKVAAPDWDAMQPVGNADGYHTAPFEAVVPESGDWTFAARSRNTSGTLSTGMRVVARTLGRNLGEQIGGIGDDLGAIGDKVSKEIADRFEADAKVASDAAADAASKAEAARIAAISAASTDATAKANAARTAAVATASADATVKANAARDEAVARADAAMAQAEALAAEIAEIVGAPEWEPGATYNAGWLVRYDGGLYRARVQTTGQNPASTPTAWEKLGDYDSVGEALAAALAATTQMATDLNAEVTRLDAVVARLPSGNGALAAQATVAANEAASVSRDNALGQRTTLIETRMPSGTGALATQATVAANESASVTRDHALGQRTTVIEARMPAGTGALATQAVVTANEAASVSRDNALAQRASVIEARMPTGSGSLATAASVTDAAQAAASANAANAERIEDVRAVIEGPTVNLVVNGNFADGLANWATSPSNQADTGVFDSAEQAMYAAGALRKGNIVPVTLVRGKTMRIEVTYKTTAGYTGWSAGGAGIVTGLSGTAWIGSTISPSTFTPTTTYRTVGANIEIPSNAPSQGYVRIANAGVTGTEPGVWIKELRLTQPTSISDLQLQSNTLAQSLIVTDAKVTQQGTDITSLASRTAALETKAPVDGGRAASEARVLSVEQAAATANSALANRTSVIEGRMPTGSDKLANEARVIAAENAAATANSALGQRLDSVSAALSNAGGDNLLANSSFEEWNGQNVADSFRGWTITTSNIAAGTRFSSQVPSISPRGKGLAFRQVGTGTGTNTPYIEVRQDISGLKAEETYTFSAWGQSPTSEGPAPRIYLLAYSAAGAVVGTTVQSIGASSLEPQFLSVTRKFPTGAAYFRAILRSQGVLNTASQFDFIFDDAKLQVGATATAWSESSIDVSSNINAVNTASVDRDTALGTRTTAIEVRMPSGADKLATEARVVSAEQAAATANSATASRVTAVEGKLPAGDGRAASEASVTQLQTVVATQGQQLAQQITTVDSKAGSAQSTATQALAAANGAASAIIDVRSNQTGGGNLLRNADFGGNGGDIGSGWEWGVLMWASRTASVNLAQPQWKPDGVNSFGITASGTPTGANYLDSIGVPAVPGEKYIVSAYLANHRCLGHVEVQFLNANGDLLLYVRSNQYQAGGGNAIAAWARAEVSGTAPSGTTQVRMRWGSESPGDGPYAWIAMPMLEKAAPGQTRPSPWSAGATGLNQATFSLQSGLNAKAGLYLTNGNLISGFESVNDGVRSEFNVLASVFRIVAPGGGERTEYSDGSWRTYDRNGVLRVQLGVWA